MTASLQLACLTCAKSFADHDGGGNAAGWAIGFMLAVLVLVLGTLFIIMLRLAKRERENLDPEFMDDSEIEART